MPTETTWTSARANLASLCDQVISTREPVIIRRRGAEEVALVAAAGLSSLMETVHLFRSPRNAERLLRTLGRARAGRSKPGSLEDLRHDLGLEDKGR